METDKIKTIAFFLVVILTLSVLGYNYYLKYQESKVPEDECYLWVVDDNNIGFAATDKCEILKKNCESANHNIPCSWSQGRDDRGDEFLSTLFAYFICSEFCC